MLTILPGVPLEVIQILLHGGVSSFRNTGEGAKEFCILLLKETTKHIVPTYAFKGIDKEPTRCLSL